MKDRLGEEIAHSRLKRLSHIFFDNVQPKKTISTRMGTRRIPNGDEMRGRGSVELKII